MGKVGSDGLSCLLCCSVGIEEDDHRRTRAAESYAENAWSPGQLLQTWQQRTERGAVRLMDAIFKRGSEQVVTALGEGSQQQHRVLNVRDRVIPRILRRQHAASFFGGENLIRDGKQQRPLSFWTDADHLRLSIIGHAGYGETAYPAGRSVVRVALAAGSLPDDLSIFPS